MYSTRLQETSSLRDQHLLFLYFHFLRYLFHSQSLEQTTGTNQLAQLSELQAF
jgi:hypothetical protein